MKIFKRKKDPSSSNLEPTTNIATETGTSGFTSPSGDAFILSNEKNTPTEINPRALVDSEGYSSPPSSDKPWETFSSTDDNDSEDALSSLSAQEKMRVEIKKSSITGENEADAVAISSVVTTLKLRHNPTRGKRDQWRMTNSQSDNFYSNPISPQRTNSMPMRKPSSPIRPSSKTSETSPIYANHTKFTTEPGIRKYELSASITETLNVITKDGEITKFLLTGEISFSHNLSMCNVNNHPPLRVKIKNLESLENFVPNLLVFKPIAEKLGEYEVDIESLSSTDYFPVVVMKYQVHIDPDDRSKFIPLNVCPRWKCEPDVMLIAISYHPNSKCKLSGVLSELSFIIPVDGNVNMVQSKPSSIWSKKQKRICCQVDDIDLSAITEKKTILARLETNQKSEPAPTAVNFKCKGRLFSDISIETVPLSNGNDDIKENYNKNIIINFNEVICQAISGKFLASS